MYKEYIERFAKVVDECEPEIAISKIEKNNVSKVVLQRSSDKFWNARDNSAFIMKNLFNSRLGFKSNFRIGYNAYLDMFSFTLSFNNAQVEKLEEFLVKNENTIIINSFEWLVFAIKEKLTLDDLSAYRQTVVQKKAEISNLFRSYKSPEPAIYSSLRSLFALVIRSMDNMREPMRNTVGMSLFNICMSIQEQYHSLTYSRQDLPERLAIFQQIFLDLEKFSMICSGTIDQNLIQDKHLFEIGTKLNAFRKTVHSQINRTVKQITEQTTE